MKKIIKFIKNNILGFLVGLSLCLNGVVIAENIITANQVTYNDSTVQTQLDNLFDAVDINERLGDTTKISNIGDGTVSSAIETMNNDLNELKPKTIVVFSLPSPNGYLAFPKPPNAKTVKVTKIAGVGYGVDRLDECTFYDENEATMAYVVPADMQGFYCEIHLECTY